MLTALPEGSAIAPSERKRVACACGTQPVHCHPMKVPGPAQRAAPAGIARKLRARSGWRLMAALGPSTDQRLAVNTEAGGPRPMGPNAFGVAPAPV